MSKALEDFKLEKKQIEEKIWSLSQIRKGNLVLDVGIGEGGMPTQQEILFL